MSSFREIETIVLPALIVKSKVVKKMVIIKIDFYCFAVLRININDIC